MSSAVSPPVTPEFKILFEQAIDLRNEERFGEAVQILDQLLRMNPISASVHAIRADTLWDLGRLAEAITAFQRAVELAPKSEMASLGLFHTLLESGDELRAIAEMDRFLSISDSDEYKGIAQRLGQRSARHRL